MKFLRVLLCLAFPVLGMQALLFGQCPKIYNIEKIASDGNVQVCLNLIEQIKNCSELQDSVAYVFHRLGVKAYRSREYKRAIEYSKKGMVVRQAFFNPFVEDLGRSYHNIGVFYRELGEFKEAERYLQLAISFYRATGNSREVRDIIELGKIFKSTGDYDRALPLFELAIDKAIEYKDTTRFEKARLDFGDVAIEKELFQKAIDSLILAEAYFKQFGPSSDLAACYNNISIGYYYLKNYKDCILFGNLAINCARSIQDTTEMGKPINNIGLAHLRSGRLKEALEYFLLGLDLGLKTNNKSLLAQSNNNLAEYYLTKNNFEKALEYFHGAICKEANWELKDVFQNPPMEHISSLPSKADILGYLFDKANFLMDISERQAESKYLNAALETFQHCDKVTDLLRSDHTEQSSKIFWREKVLPIYEKAIHACYLAGDMEKAFEFLEKSRAVLLLDAMVQAEVLNDIGDEALKAEEKRIINALYKTRESLNKATEEEKSSILPKLKKLNDERDQLTKTIEEKYPGYFELMYETSVVPLETLKQNQLHDGKTALMHYFLGSEKSWLFVYNGIEDPVLMELGSKHETDSLVGDYLSFFSNDYAIANNPKGYITAANKLYEYLVAPAGLEGMEKLIIIPDGLLGFLPFEALLTKPVDHTNLETLPYLIRDFEVRLSFSATILEQQTSGQVGAGKIMAFAPFSESGSGEFAALPYTAKEISFLQKIISGNFYKSQKAQKSLLSQWSDRYSILHLSTHAEANMAAGQPLIAFADTVLTLQELYAMNLPSDLIVLSACETNLGEVKSGEGIFSLSRGFTYAGANSIIASLWKVNAASTGQIFPGFYANLKEGNTKAEALRMAKLEYLNAPDGGGHIKTPYDWAGFAMMGNNETIKLKPPMGWWKYLIPIVILVGAFLIWRKNK
ncbi:MAG: CHAT domain-containing protein [Bacteroidetes bacterium]|nr:MAG: CHAT domain-containing protein [Bacteroidota bacterium]